MPNNYFVLDNLASDYIKGSFLQLRVRDDL